MATVSADSVSKCKTPTSQQEHVYAAAQSISDLRCGDLVDVEWETCWYPGVVTDVPEPDLLAVSYTNGDFEEGVPHACARLRFIPKKRRSGASKAKKGDKNRRRLADAANAGDIGLVLQALREGCDPRGLDEFGYTPLHWAAGPDEGMPGDTISRRACIAILSKLGDVDAQDCSNHAFRAVQHTVVRNLVGCLKCFFHVGADMSGTVHWAANAKAHGVLRELLRLDVSHEPNKNQWEGCTPLMLTAAGHDAYGMQLILDSYEHHGGRPAVLKLIHTTQLGGKLRATALHHASDAAADGCTSLLLIQRADPEVCNARSETPLAVARSRAKLLKMAGSPHEASYEAALRCVHYLELAIEQRKTERRVCPMLSNSLTPLPFTRGRECGSGSSTKELGEAYEAMQDMVGAINGSSATHDAPGTNCTGGTNCTIRWQMPCRTSHAFDHPDVSEIECHFMHEGKDDNWEQNSTSSAELWDKPIGELLCLVPPPRKLSHDTAWELWQRTQQPTE